MAPLELQLYSLELPSYLAEVATLAPWEAADRLADVLVGLAHAFGDDFVRTGDSIVHTSAEVHPSAVLTGPVVVEAGAVVGPHARLRNGVYLGRGCVVGPSTEVKSSWVFEDVALAHLNYVGNSVIGYGTNIEAGAVLANHFNEREDKSISVLINNEVHHTGLTKFGAAVAPVCRIGANAVTTPGTYLAPASIVGRLELVDHLADR